MLAALIGATTTMALAQPPPGTKQVQAPLRGVKVTTEVEYEDPGNPDSPPVAIVLHVTNGALNPPARDFHIRPRNGRVQATMEAGVVGWSSGRGRHGGLNIWASGPDSRSIEPGETGVFRLVPTDPRAPMDLGVRWYATASGTNDTPPWTPRRTRRSGAPGGTTPTPAGAPGGTTPYGGGIIDFGPKVPNDPTTGVPTARATIGHEEDLVCTVGADPTETTISAHVSHPCAFVVVVGEDLSSFRELEAWLPAPSPWVLVDYLEPLVDNGPARVLLTALPGAPAGLEVLVVVDDDCDGIVEPAWDLVSATVPLLIR